MNTLRAILLQASSVLAATVLFGIAAPPGASAQSYGSTLTQPASPTKAPGPDGFLQRWIILDPIHVNGVTQNAVQAAVKTNYFPGQFTVIPRDGDKVTAGDAELTWHAVDSSALNKPFTNVLFWAVTIVNCPEEMRDVRLAIGSNDASVWWVNGQEVIGIYGDRQTVIDDGVSKKLTLNKGPNVIRCAVHNQGGATDFCARFLDAQNKPVKNLSLSLGDIGK